jgi:hypothetical protein
MRFLGLPLRTHLLLLALLLVLVTIYTYPLIREPGGLLPDHHDPRVFSWVMATNAERMFSSPTTLYQGNVLYPHGSTVTYSEPLLVPGIVYTPVYLATRNPVLAYNLTLLVFWALSGWALFVLAYGLTRSRGAALLAALAFTLCPYRIEYYLEFQMQLAFGIPLAFYGWQRFLVTQRWRPLWIAVAGFLLTALSTLYYAIILALALAAFALVYLSLHWRGWRRATLIKLAAAAAVQAAVLAPFLWPYVRTRAELGFERVLALQPAWHSADILTYWETRSTWLYRSPFHTDAETVLFMGFVTTALALLTVLALGRRRSERGGTMKGEDVRGEGDQSTRVAGPPPVDPEAGSSGGPETGRWTISGPLVPLAIGAICIGFAALWRPAPGSAGWYLPLAGAVFGLFFGLAGFAAEGWRRWQAGDTRREISTQDWVLALLYLIFLFTVLSLGPTVRFDGQPVGAGLYGYAYVVLPFLRAIRVLTRVGVIVVFAVSLLAAFGAARLADRFSQRIPRAATYAGLSLLILLEFWSAPLAYAPAPWPPEIPAYARLAEVEQDVAVVEIPLYADKPDADEMLSSLYYRKFLVNGVSGFVPPFTVGLAQNLLEPRTVFPSQQTMAMLRSIYPLRYVLVHPRPMARRERAKWEELKSDPPPGLRLEGHYGASDLYELIATPETGDVILRQFSYDFVRRHPRAAVALRRVWVQDGTTSRPETAADQGVAPGQEIDTGPEVGTGGVRSRVDVSFNGRPLDSLELTDETQELSWSLDPPYMHSAANRLIFSHSYEIDAVDPDDARYRIGDAGPLLQFDLMAAADNRHPGSTSSLMVNGRRTTMKQPGYNLIVIDQQTGEVISRANFATDRDPQASADLFHFVDELAAGSIVVVATSGDAFAQLGVQAQRALRACGSALDLSRHPGAAHVMIGYKGAEPGTVPERTGEGVVRVVVGQDPERLTMELVAFDLLARQ